MKPNDFVFLYLLLQIVSYLGCGISKKPEPVFEVSILVSVEVTEFHGIN